MKESADQTFELAKQEFITKISESDSFQVLFSVIESSEQAFALNVGQIVDIIKLAGKRPSSAGELLDTLPKGLGLAEKAWQLLHNEGRLSPLFNTPPHLIPCHNVS
jgi:hypothetical protein